MIKTIRDIDELIPEMRDLTIALMKLFKDKNSNSYIELMITETYRTQKRQDWLYAKGRTIKGSKVTWTTHSKHTERKAVDFAILYKGKPSWDTKIKAVLEGYRLIGKCADDLGLIWGGNWKKPDMPHVQYD